MFHFTLKKSAKFLLSLKKLNQSSEMNICLFFPLVTAMIKLIVSKCDAISGSAAMLFQVVLR